MHNIQPKIYKTTPLQVSSTNSDNGTRRDLLLSVYILIIYLIFKLCLLVRFAPWAWRVIVFCSVGGGGVIGGVVRGG